MEEKNISLAPPWQTYYYKLRAMFSNDPEIELSMSDFVIDIKVKSVEKAAALTKLLVDKITMGNIELEIHISAVEPDIESLYSQAFRGNPIYIKFALGTPEFKIDYCIFKNEVIQFYNDNVSDYYGNYNGLPSKIAKEIFKKQYYVGYSIEEKEHQDI